MREDGDAPGKRSVLAGLLPGVQGEVPSGREDHENMPAMREILFVLIDGKALATVLPGLLGESMIVAKLRYTVTSGRQEKDWSADHIMLRNAG